jgi:formylglycine-generating enzyme required for sulfatase activity
LDARGNVLKRETKQARYFVEDLGDGVKLEMVEIPADSFQMGSNESEVQAALADAKRYDTGASLELFKVELPKHMVLVSEFYIGRFEVTREQWRQVARLPKVNVDLNEDPSNFKDSWRQPVEQVSWAEAVEFCERLQKKTGRAYRLPTEAEWEYAARASTTSPFAFGETVTPDIVNYHGDYPYSNAPKSVYRGKTVPVGSLGVANAFGLFDMHGNVWEWCQDVWHNTYNGAPTDGSARLSGGNPNFRVVRGGSWFGNGRFCRATHRSWERVDSRVHYNGLRVVVSARM